MAQNMTPEEIQAEFAAYADAVKNGTSNTREWAERMKDAEAGVAGYTKQLNASLKGLQTSALATMGALKDGQTGQSVYNDALSKGADAVSDFASKFGIIGAVIGAVVKAATAYVTAVNKQSDALLKGYKEISKVGATGADGMTGVFQSMQKFGYGIDDLDKMAGLIKENSESLALFSGTASEGTKRLASVAGEIQRSSVGRDLREMGMSIDDINKASAGYLRQQVLIGKNATSNERDLAANTAAYIKELNALSKLTGQSREQQEAAIEAAQKQESMNQVLYELDQKAAAGDKSAEEQAKKLRDIQISSLPKELKDELAKAIGGDVSAASKLMMVAPNLYKDAMDSNKSFDQTMDSAATDLKRSTDAMGSTAKLNIYGDLGGSIADTRKFLTQYTGENAEALRKKAEAEQKITDPLAKAAVDNEIKQNNSRDAMQSMLQKGIVPVTEGMSKLSGVIDKVTGGAAKAIGAAPAGGAAPLGGGAPPSAPAAAPAAPAAAPAKPAAPAETGGGAAVGGMKGGMKAGAASTPAAPAETGGGVAVGGMKGGMKAGAASTPAAPAVAKGGAAPPTSGGVDPNKAVTGKDLSGVNEGLAGAIKSAATEFMAVTGKQVTVTSSIRTPEEQQALWDNFKAGKSKYPAAPPGKSKHDRGEAVDIDSAVANALDQQGLLSKYGLSRPVPNDPVHIELAKGYADGGVATGPTSGYKAELQGTNAVVPLPSGQQIPVEMPEFNTNLADQTQILTQQLAKLDELMRVMQAQVGVSTKILQSQA
jgi:DNA-binding transcriptional MerR regulator